MANEAYRAVFLRVHPTGKMVLSLTTEPDGKEAEYAQLVADELGVPALDVKVVPVDTDRFGVGHGYNTSPSEGTVGGDHRAPPRRSAPRHSCWRAWRSETSPESLKWFNGAWVARRRKRPDAGQDGRGSRPLRARHRRPAARGRGRTRRADRLHGVTRPSERDLVLRDPVVHDGPVQVVEERVDVGAAVGLEVEEVRVLVDVERDQRRRVPDREACSGRRRCS